MCSDVSVGYANPSYYRDSSVAVAFLGGVESFVREKEVRVWGNQTYWSTEMGTFWMDTKIREEIDTTELQAAARSLICPDVFVTQNLTITLVSSKGCRLGTADTKRISLRSMQPPGWIAAPPDNNNAMYAVGVAPGYFYEASSWMEAEKVARRNLARAVFSRLKASQMVDWEGHEIRKEGFAVRLHGARVVARWRDLEHDTYFVLIRMGDR